MRNKPELMVDPLGCMAVPMFDAVKGSMVITIDSKRMRRVKCKSDRYLVLTYPITHQTLKAVGEAAVAALKERIYVSVLILSRQGEIGFAAFREQ